jgi:anti-sigma factor RsiW
MTPDELEYAISQYLDGALPPLEKAALEERLAGDAEARAILEEYRKLNTALKTTLPAAPQIAWDRLAEQIHRNLEAEATPVRHFRLLSIGWTGRMAIAAALLFVISVAIHFVPRNESPTSNPRMNPGIAMISGPAVESSVGATIADVSIGPPPSPAIVRSAGDDIVTRPTIVLIDRAAPSGQDGDSSMY